MERELRAIVGDEAVLADAGWYLTDITGLPGKADAVVLPTSADEVARVLAWCYEHDVPVTPRGGGTGVAGGAVPLEGGIEAAYRAEIDAAVAWAKDCPEPELSEVWDDVNA